MILLRFLVRRALWMLAVVFFVATTTFVLTRVVSDPARIEAGPHASDLVVRTIRHNRGYDQPLHVQYGRYLARLLRGNLDRSYHLNQDVSTAIAERFPRTALLAAAAALLQLLIGVGVGLVCAVKRNTLIDWGAMTGALLGISMPTFVTGLLLLYALAFRLGWFPIGGYGQTMGEHLTHLVLPALTLGAYGAAYYSRLVRGDMIEILGQDYVRTAMAKGLTRRTVVLKHALANGMIPIVTVLGLDLGVLLSGAIITESIFAWPGMGRMTFDAILQGDRNLIMGTVLFSAVLITGINFLVDVAYALIDPRVRLS